jgi:hypothetical protein
MWRNLNLNVSIPVITCMNSGDFPSEAATSQQRLTEFVNTWYMSDPTQRAGPFNTSLTVSDIVITGNRWAVMLTTPFYVAMFSVVIPMVYLIIMLMAWYFAHERLAKARRARRRRRLCARLKLTLTPPFLALFIEACSTAFIAIFYFIDGWWANAGNPLEELRELFYGALFLVSLSTSVFVGLNFSDFRKAQEKAEMLSGESFVDRHRTLLWFVATVFLATEVLGGVLRDFQMLYILVNGITMMLLVAVSLWFYLEAGEFSRALNRMATVQEGPSKTAGAMNAIYKAMVRRITRWTYIACFSCLGAVGISFVLTFHPFMLWRVDNWPVCWLVFHIFRCLFSLSKVMLCRLPRGDRLSRNRTRAVADATSSSSLVAPSSETVGEE